MFKKVLAILLALTFVFAFAACGKVKTDVVPDRNAAESSTKPPRVEYDVEDYTPDICANCEIRFEGKAYEPSELFKSFILADIDEDELAICEDCAKGMYKDELAAGKSLDEFLKK